MTIEVVRDLSRDQWRRVVAEQPTGTVFHTPEMADVFARARGHRPELWAAVEGGEVLALLTPVRVSVGPDAARFLATRAIAYGGVLRVPGADGQAGVDRLLAAYERHVDDSVLFTELRHLADVGDLAPVLAAHGYDHEPHLDYLIDLDRPADDVLAGFSRSTRKQVRRGVRQGRVVVGDVTTPGGLDEWYEVLAGTYRTARVPLADRSLFDAAFAVLQPAGMARFVIARVDDACVAASVELAHGEVLFGWYGGVDRDYGALTPNELLMWDVLRTGVEEGRRVYDFGGAGHPDEPYGVRDFKAKFGGTLVDLGRDTRVHARVRLRLARAGYAAYRRLLPTGA